MKLNPFKKKTWSETILELENRAVLVADERVSFVLRCRDLALASEAGEAVAVREMKTLTDKDYELSRRQKTIGDALAAARAGLESERVEAERLAEGARRKAITDVEERIYKMLDQTDAAIKTAGESVAALQAEARRLQTALLEKRLEQERKDYQSLLNQTKQLELDNLKERQGQQLRDVSTKGGEERDRYIREHKEAQRILEQLKEQRERDRSLDPPKRIQ